MVRGSSEAGESKVTKDELATALEMALERRTAIAEQYCRILLAKYRQERHVHGACPPAIVKEAAEGEAGEYSAIVVRRSSTDSRIPSLSKQEMFRKFVSDRLSNWPNMSSSWTGVLLDWVDAETERANLAEAGLVEFLEISFNTIPEDLVCLAEVACPSCGETMTSRLGTELKASRDAAIRLLAKYLREGGG